MSTMDYYQHLLQPVSGDSPCGENLDYDPAFLLLQAKLQPRLGAEYGEFVEVADPVNWAEIERECQALLAKSRDIRLMVTLIRCRLRVVGLTALAEGLKTLVIMLQQWPDDLWPQLLEDGEFEPLLRANALNELEDMHGLINDVRQHMLPRAVGVQCAVKDLEKALAFPRDESALPEATVRAMLNEWREKNYPEMSAPWQAQQTLKVMTQMLSESLGDVSPAFTRLEHLLGLFTSMGQPAVEAVSSETSTPVTVPATVSPAESQESLPIPLAPTAVASPVQGLNSRAQALLSLREVQAWFVAMEPGSPIILLLEFAIKTSGKSFTELMQLLPVEIVSHLNTAGRE